MAVIAQSILNNFRLNANRLDYYQPVVFATIGGTRCETQIRKSTVRVTKRANSNSAVQGTTNQCQFRMKHGSVTPAAGQDVKLYVGTTAPQSLRFGGTIQNVAQVYEQLQANVAFDITAIGYLGLFNRRLVTKSYVGQNADAVVTDLVSTFASGITTNHVVVGLPSVNISFDHVAPADALNQIAELVDARWFIDDSEDLWFFVTDTRYQPSTITGLSASNPISNPLSLTAESDLSQVRTRVIVTGAGTTTNGAPCLPYQSVIVVKNALPFSLGTATSGTAQIQTPQPSSAVTIQQSTTSNVTYTGVLRGGTVASPGTLTGITFSPTTGGSLTGNAAYQYAFSYVTSNGETAVSPAIDVFVPTGDSNVNFTFPTGGTAFYVQTSGTASVTRPPDPSITAINVYRSVANGAQLFYAGQIKPASTDVQWPTTFSDSTADSGLGTAPSLLTSAPQGESSTTTADGANLGATTIGHVANLGAFDPAGGYAYAGPMLIHYTSYALINNGNQGTLTVDALTGSIAAGGTITAAPALTGCTGNTAYAPTAPNPAGHLAASAALTVGTAYSWEATFVNGSGESLPGSASPAWTIPTTPTGVSAANGGAGAGPTNGGVYAYIVGIQNATGILSLLSTASGNLTSNGTGITVTATVQNGTVVTSVYVFRTKAGVAGTYYLISQTGPSIGGGGTAFSCVDNTPDVGLGGTSTATWVERAVVAAIPIGPSGVTSRKLYRNTGPGTTYQLVTTVADNTTTSYTDTTTDAGLGAAAPTTDTSGGILGLPLTAAGTTITPYAQADDTSAQSAIAALEGGDGIHEHKFSDSSLLTYAAMLAAAQGDLTLFKTVASKLTVISRDARLQPGVTLPLSIGAPTNLSASYLIQDIAVDQFEAHVGSLPYVYPRITAHGSTVRWTLDDFLWKVHLLADGTL